MPNEKHITKLDITGFKSIKEICLEMNSLNILVGANGSGKSNLLSFFKLLRAFIDGELNTFVMKHGGAGDMLFNGRKNTESMSFSIRFSIRGFRFKLVPTAKDECTVEDEARYFDPGKFGWWPLGNSPDGTSNLVKEIHEQRPDAKHSYPIYEAISSWQIYHFHDTSSTAGMRHAEIVQDDENLREDASNIAPFLLRIKNDYPNTYKEIVNAVCAVTPFFESFNLQARRAGSKVTVNLSWKQKGSDYPMQPYHFSDGTIRFVCLAVALLQPNPPATIIIDEPELGLHPSAIAALAELIQSASEKTQIIIATQSPLLIDHFAVEDIIVASREDGASTFTRLNADDYTQWLEDYSLGELLTKNVIQGGPVCE